MSPDGSVEVFRRDRNLWLRELASGEERPLTSGGEQYNECGWFNGEFQVYVYLESRMPPQFHHWWSFPRMARNC